MIAAAEMVAMAAALVEAGVLCGLEAMAKLLASQSSWFAADVCLQIQRPHGLGGRVRHRMQIRRDAALGLGPISKNLILRNIRYRGGIPYYGWWWIQCRERRSPPIIGKNTGKI
jgi:acyl-CoA dehydrogenase